MLLPSFQSSKPQPTIVPDLPDFHTSVNIHEHKLTRPTGPPKTRPIARWKELDKLKETTKVCNVDFYDLLIFVQFVYDGCIITELEYKTSRFNLIK